MKYHAEPRGSVENLQKVKQPLCDNDGNEETRKIHEALSNKLILQNIFINVSIDDLKACSDVNKFWQSEANFCMKQFNVEFFYSELSDEETITVQEITGLGRKSKKSEVKFLDLAPTIARDKKSSRVHIALHLNRIHIHHAKLLKFLKKFGHLVFRLNYECFHYVSLSEFSKFLWKYLPNLMELHMDEFWLENISDEPVIPEEDKKCLQALKTISFFKQNPPVERRFDLSDEPFLAIFNMAPNLQVIESFPAERAHILALTGKSKLVRDIQFPKSGPSGMGNEMKLWLKSLSKLKLQLSSFEIPRSPRMCSAKTFQFAKKYITTILKSSRRSLEHLTIFPTQRHSFVYYPYGLSRVRVLELTNESNHHEHTLKMDFLRQMGLKKRKISRRRFFHKRANLRNILPKLKEIKISLEDIAPHNVFIYFPGGTFQDLLIIKLHVNKAASLCLENLSQVFPLVEHLTMDITQMKVQEIKDIIKDISAFPHLKSIRLEINSHKFFHDDDPDAHLLKKTEEIVVFDSILTGIPEDTCEILRKTMLEDVEQYRTEPSLLGIKGLENLEIIFINKLPYNYRWTWTWDCYCFPTPLFSQVSSKYGFQAHPHVKVTVRVEDEHQSIDTEMMIQAVGDALKDIQLDMSYKREF